jgi:hypothetical protein
MAVFAQTTQQPAQPPAGGATTTAQEAARPSDTQSQMTLVGCVQREADYRRAKDAGQGGVAGTGVGAGNEFVLVHASNKESGAQAGATSPGAAVGTSGTAGEAYELTGSGEGQLAQYVGKRVEIVGRQKAMGAGSDASPSAGASASGSATAGSAGGATSGSATGSASGRTPEPGRTPVIGQDLNLKEFEVVSVRESTGECPSIQR